ncbi:leucine-rich PPR motif-containing protein, mitochondrial [Toxorhynchites rutilus septentrionalis]|uniref:leucine-rich PPR motif-containing protein, mitochondrial n=1 Tax=Toxorhynchites rutilus septentrionalis TaxID=329112 RepID=UPI00247A3EA7|nr:leucine-rich PPR motif-containing protein, mitochondrial [Toxorhynchites rutilus septentrionalis]
MASILRSSKFVRYFAGFARNIVFSTARDTEGSFVQQSQCLCGNSFSGFASSAVSSSQGLDRSLKRLDDDVRRSGRISRRDLEDVLEEIRINRSATSAQSLLVIRCCGNLVPEELPEVRTALVQEIWKTLQSLNVAMDISHYNALLRVYLDNEHSFSPTEFLTDLKSKGVEPNRVTYQRLISRYCQEGDIEGATKILEYMREKQLPVNEYVFNALVMGHSQADDLESATGILAVMAQAGLQPSADTYTTLLCGYARKGDIDFISKTLETCEAKEIYLLDKDILEIIYYLSVNGYSDKVDPLIAKIRKQAGYNQDAVNVILRLINKGQEDVGLKLLKTMPRATRNDGELANTGGFLIKQLVKAKRPVEKVLEICGELQSAGMNSNAFSLALETALKNGISNLAYPLLKTLNEQNLPVRQHYFWPLLCSNELNRPEGVLNVLSAMLSEFDMHPSSETIREYAIPNLGVKNSEEVIQLLRTAGISSAVASSGCAFVALEKNDIKEAANIASRYKAFYSPGVFRKVLVSALVHTKDFESYIRFSRFMYDNLVRVKSREEVSEQAEEDDNATPKYQADVLGAMIYDVLVSFQSKRTEALHRVLTGFVNHGLSISNAQAEKIQDKLGAEMTTEISDLLSKLAAGDLEPVELESVAPRVKAYSSSLSIPQIERLIRELQSRGENTNTLKSQLIRSAVRANDIPKTEEILTRLEEENYVIQPGVYAQIIELYVNNDKLEQAFALIQRVKTQSPDFELDYTKVVKFANAILNQDRFEDTLKFLAEYKPSVGRDENEVDFNYNSSCWRLLNALAEGGKVDQVNKLFDHLLDLGYITPQNIFLGSLIKVHLVKDDVQSAIAVFEEICQKYRTTPWKSELTCRLIQAEDATNLQRLTDLSTEVHGEVNSLYDLVFAFVDCGRIRQARKILETPGLRTRYQRIQSACERYHVEGKTQSLEGLMEATKDLNHIDRTDIYHTLLKSYINEKEPEKALGLWTKMQEEDETPSDAFLIELSTFLKTNGYEVPFIVPEAKAQTEPPARDREASKNVIFSEPKKRPMTALKSLKAAIKTGDADGILSARDSLQAGDKLNLTETSRIIEALVNKDRLNEASKMVMDLLEKQLYPMPRIFKYFLNKLATAGDMETFNRIGGMVSDEVKRLISFDNRYCHANMVSGNIESYMAKLEKSIDSAKSKEEAELAIKHFPVGGASGILVNHPELHERYRTLAERYIQWDILSPMNALWAHHFLAGEDEQAKQIWDKYLSNCPRVMFQRIIKKARETQDDEIVRRLIVQLKDSKISENGIGVIYSCLIDTLVTKGQVEQGLEALNEALKSICLENVNRSALKRLKDGLVAAGKDFPHKIPDRSEKKAHDTSSSSSSSSSSDDDVGRTRK